MENPNLKVLFINIFLILYISGTSSLHRLQLDLEEIESTLKNVDTKIPLVPEMLTFILSTFVIAKFIFGYVNLAAHVVAFYPILNYDLSDLLMPTIISQAFQNVIFNFVELSFGYFTCRYYLNHAFEACSFFYFKMISRIILGIVTLNFFWSYYTFLRYPDVRLIPTRRFLKQIAPKTPANNEGEITIYPSYRRGTIIN